MNSAIFIYFAKISGWLAASLLLVIFRDKVSIIIKKWRTTNTSALNLPIESKVLNISIVIAFLMWAILSLAGMPEWMSITLILSLLWFSPGVVNKVLHEKYLQSFDASLVEGITSIAASLRAGLPLIDSLQAAASNCKEPFRSEVSQAVNSYHLGSSLQEALSALRQRICTENSAMAIGAMIVTQKLGGNLPLTLTRISTTIRERHRVLLKLAALTAQGRTQAYIVCAAPPVVAAMMCLWDPAKMQAMTQTGIGQALIVTAIVLEAIGIYLTNRILKLEY